jgi:poly(3-hydroxybutyrate) depolymerase
VIAFPAAAQAALPQKLGAYKVDPSAISVSGISSGGYTANQVHVAYSAHLMGAGIVAGGPFRCAEAGSFPTVQNAISMCSVRNPTQSGRSFRRNPATDSDGSRPPIPMQTGHPVKVV